jgi:hypothetical protein
MRLSHCLALLCVLVLTGCARTASAPPESLRQTFSEEEWRVRSERFRQIGYACLTNDQFEAALKSAKQSGTSVPFDNLNENHIGKTCIIHSKSGGNGFFGSPCPSGMVKINLDNTQCFEKLQEGDIYEIGQDSVRIVNSFKRGGAFKKDIQSIIIVGE